MAKKISKAQRERNARREKIISNVTNNGSKWQIAVTQLNNWPHYVFFSSLAQSANKTFVNSSKRAQASPYSQIYNQAQAHINHLSNLIGNSSSGQMSKEAKTLTDEYLKFLLQLAKDARQAERAYLQRKKAQILNDDNGIPPEVRTMIEEKIFNPIEQGSTIEDYQSLLATFQYAMGSTYKKRQQELNYVLQQMEQQQAILTQLKTSVSPQDQETYKKLQKSFQSSNFSSFNAILKSIKADQITSPAVKIAEKIKGLIKKLNTDNQFRQEAITHVRALAANKITLPQACSVLKTYIIQFIENYDFNTIITETSEKLFQDFSAYFKSKQFTPLDSSTVTNITGILGESKQKTLADYFIKSGSIGKSFDDLIEVDVTAAEKVIQLLFDDGLLTIKEKDYLRDYIHSSDEESKKMKSQVSRLLNSAIIGYAQNRWYNRGHHRMKYIINRRSNSTQRQKAIQEMGEQRFRQFLAPLERIRKKAIDSSIEVDIELPGFMLGETRVITELISEKDILTAIHAGGQILKTKADIQVVWSFDETTFLQLYEPKVQTGMSTVVKDLYSDLKELLEKEEQEFQQLYVKNSKGATDVQAAIDAKIEALQNLKKALMEKLGRDESTAKKILQDLIFSDISVKEYKYGTNEFGFHAGALGAGGKVEPVIHNIVTMYEQGGLTVPDEQILVDAVINCGSDMLGHGLQLPISNLLLGGAAMILFDQGFGTTSGFQQRIKSELGLAEGTNQMNLIRVNSVYVPASFLYQIIYNQLSGIDNMMSNLFSNVNNSIIINTIDESANPGEEVIRSAPQRFEIVRQIALSETTIEFQFLSGLIDVIQAIQKAFEVTI